MATIGLIRHGITDWNVQGKAQGLSDIPLNEEGRKQAERLANRLCDEEWDLIISSPLSRARETARIIASATGVSLTITDDRIREIDCGLIEGMTQEERIHKWGENWRELDLGMEKFEDVAARGTHFLEETYKRYYSQKLLVVCHAALIGLTLKRLMPHIFQTTYIENTSLTLLTKEQDEWVCKLYNCTDHLTSK